QGLRMSSTIYRRCAIYTRFRELTDSDLELHRTSVDHLQRLAEEQPADCEIQMDACRTHLSLTGWKRHDDRFPEAEDHARKAMALLIRLTRDSPKVIIYRWRLAACYAQLAEVLDLRGQIPAA